jgi:hypothetical protein
MTQEQSDIFEQLALVQQQQAMQTQALRRILEGRLEGADGAAGLIVALEGGHSDLEVGLGKD